MMSTRMTAALYDPQRKHRLHPWFNTKTSKHKFGIQQHHPELRVWAHAHYRGEFLIFDTRHEANAFIKAAKMLLPLSRTDAENAAGMVS